MKKNSSAYYIAKQAAQPPSYFGIHKDAIRAWELLRDAQDENPNYPCKDDPYFYTDYDGLGFPELHGEGNPQPLTDDQAEQLCHGCPLMKQCYDFAVANNEQYGLWGGILFNKRVDF